MVLAGSATVVLGHALPAATTLRTVRRATPRLAGVGSRRSVALTFDDGPDPRSTPAFLDALATLDVRATFFVLGSMLAAAPDVGRRLVDAGHEVAVHGATHRNHLLLGPRRTYEEIARAADLVGTVTGVRPRWFRPPYGVLTSAAAVSAHRLGLRPVLWTAWGRDWEAQASAQSVLTHVATTLRAGGVVLLHDSDCTSAPGSWRSALAALPALAEIVHSLGAELGPLGRHLAGP